MLSADRLRELLKYAPETGLFIWKIDCVSAHGCVRVPRGRVAGWKDSGGQILIGINNERYYANRLAWLYMTGEWPQGKVTHRNLNKSDNRWDNLQVSDGKAIGK